LTTLLTAAAERPAGADWYDLAGLLRNRHPAGVRAIIGYGSWYADGLRKPTSFPDAYLVVDGYDGFYRHASHAWWNRVLPPNVYYVWADEDDARRLRGKYNVISAGDLEHECGPRLRDVYNAGRLTKIVWLAWARDDGARAEVVSRLVSAHLVLAPMALAFLPPHFHRDQFSLELLALSFRGEARLEGWERVRTLHAAYRAHYEPVHEALLDAFGAATGLIECADGDPARRRKVDSPEWDSLAAATRGLLRRSRLRGYFRWPRIVLTEPNLLDLAVNEAERKAGVRVHVTSRLRRHPLLYGLPEFLRVLRERSDREGIDRRTPRRGDVDRAP
jgi:hypothetical protein